MKGDRGDGGGGEGRARSHFCTKLKTRFKNYSYTINGLGSFVFKKYVFMNLAIFTGLRSSCLTEARICSFNLVKNIPAARREYRQILCFHNMFHCLATEKTIKADLHGST